VPAVTGDVDAVSSPESSDARLWAAASRLPTAASTVELWTGVANDRRYRPFHRGLAAYQLFRRHVRVPVPVGELRSLLAGAGWLRDTAIERVRAMGGEVPVPVPPDGVVFVVRLPASDDETVPALGLYLALDRAIDAGRLRDSLMAAGPDPAADRAAAPPDPAAGRATVVGVAVFPGG
jgi:hypothetical protein